MTIRAPRIAARALAATITVVFAAASAGTSSDAEWPQWGGPLRNFKSGARSLADSWPPDGPRKFWTRPLGEGYSAISVSGGKLFTMFRRGNSEVIVALEASTGRTLWEHAYAAPFTREYSVENGPGPHATPLVVAGRVFTAGATGILHALDAASGKLQWSHDLFREYDGTLRVNGYACSPLAYQDLVIVMVGGRGRAVMAFHQRDGAVAWSSQDFQNSASSPVLIRVDGQEQLVAFTYSEILAVEPREGRLLWSHPHETSYGLNVSMPVWGEDNLLFVSSGYNGGSRVLRLGRAGATSTAEQVWASNLMRVHFTNVIRVGDVVYGSSGDFGGAPFTAVDVNTGQVLWRYRGLARSSLLYADGRFIMLDEDGTLALAIPTREGLKVQCKTPLLENNAWTVPTLAGTALYARDRKNIMALDLK